LSDQNFQKTDAGQIENSLNRRMKIIEDEIRKIKALTKTLEYRVREEDVTTALDIFF